MSFRKNYSDQAVICLDIGKESVKLIKGIKRDGRVCVLKYAFRSYASEDASPDVISSNIKELVSAVSSMREVKRIKVNTVIPSRKMCIRVIRMPVIPQDELYEAVKSKIRHFISTDFENIVFSFNIIRQVQEKGIDQFEIVFVALPRPVLDMYLQLFDFVRTSPKVIAPICFSGWNLIRETEIYQKFNSIMVINIEHQDTDLTVYQEGRLIFTRNIPIGTRNFINILKGHTQFSLTDSTSIKQLWDMDAKEPDNQSEEESLLTKIRSQLQNEAELLKQEVELTAHHYYQIAHGQRVDQCLILGSINQVGGLVDFLKKKLDISVDIISLPEDKLELPARNKGDSQWDLPLYAQALGALCHGSKDINILDQVQPEAKPLMKMLKLPQLNQSLSRTALAAVLFILSTFMIVLALQGRNIYYKSKVKSYTVKREQLQDQSMQLMHVKRKMDKLDFERKLYARLIKERPSYPAIIEEIRKAMPENGIVLESLKFNSEKDRRSSDKTARYIKFNISGKVIGSNITETEVTKFMLALEKSGLFANISVSIKGKTFLQRNDRSREQLSNFREDEISGRGISELPFVIDGTLQKDRSVVN